MAGTDTFYLAIRIEVDNPLARLEVDSVPGGGGAAAQRRRKSVLGLSTLSFFRNKRVWVSAHSGLLGAAIVRRLWHEQCELILADPSQLDLLRQDAVEAWFHRQRPDIAFLAEPAGSGLPVGSTERLHSLRGHLLANLNVLSAAFDAGVQTLVNLTACCIPTLRHLAVGEDAKAPDPVRVAAWAGITLTKAYAEEHGCRYFAMGSDTVRGSDGSDFRASSTDPLKALVHQISTAARRRQYSIIVDANVGHSLLHVSDLADAAVLVARSNETTNPVYCGLSGSISHQQLAELVAEVVGYAGQLLLRPASDTEPMDSGFFIDAASIGWRAHLPLRDQIRQIHEAFSLEAI